MLTHGGEDCAGLVSLWPSMGCGWLNILGPESVEAQAWDLKGRLFVARWLVVARA